MKKIIFILIITTGIISSCSNEVKEYHNNGRLKRTYFLENNNYQGTYKEYDALGNLIQEHIYSSGKKVDSSIFYSTRSDKSRIEKIIYWSDSLPDRITNYNDDGTIKSKGFLGNDNVNSRIGKWRFYNYKKNIDSIVEYVNYKNKPYANQIWLIDSKEDTLLTKGNYYRINLSQDTIGINELVKIQLFLFQPFYSYHQSEVSVVIPKNQNELKDDYSNIFDIQTDTYENLNNDGIPRLNLDKSIPKNRIVAFGHTYDKPGKKKIRGVLIEKMKKKDSILLERFLFFDKDVYVKDNQK